MDWLIDVWNTHKDTILPILSTIVTGALAFLIVYVRNVLTQWILKMSKDGKLSEQNKELLLGVVDKMASKEQLVAVESRVSQILSQQSISDAKDKLIAEMLQEIAKGSNLTEEAKSKITSMYSKVLYTTDTSVISVLEGKLKLATDKIAALEAALATPVVIPEAQPAETVKRVRT